MAVFELTFDDHLATASYQKAEDITGAEVETLKAEKEEINKQIERLIDVIAKIPNQQNAIDRIQELTGRQEEIELKIFSFEQLLLGDETNISTSSVQDYGSQEFYLFDAARTEMMKIASDKVYLRETLKKTSYEIVANGKQATVHIGPDELQEFTVLRRSQKHSCYIVRQRSPAYVTEKDNNPEDIISYLETNLYLAINRFGIMEHDTDQDSLLNKLETRRPDAPLEIEFGNREDYEYTEEMKEEARTEIQEEARSRHEK